MTNLQPLRTSYDPKLVLSRIEAELNLRRSWNALTDYRPYAKQREFHEQGGSFRERLLMAANQVGKTLSASMETAMHLTGNYPDDWKGKRFDKATHGWAAGKSGTDTRDNCQRLLLGRPGSWGTGSIPKDAILSTSAGRGVADSVDTIIVRHRDGDRSTLTFKTYDQGRERWQGETLDWVWFDEEPPEDIYTEGLTRTNATNGITYITFTPLLGMSNVVRRFVLEKPLGTSITVMTIDDAEHFTPAQRETIRSSYQEFEREARTRGIPQLGSGRVFPISESRIKCESFPIPGHWPRICGLDFGWDHPSAAAQLAWDRDSDCLYVIACYRARNALPSVFSAAVKPWGDYPWAWPHDGFQHDKGSGIQLAKQYRDTGLKLLGSQATFEDGSNGVEAGIVEMLERMETGRFKVFAHLLDWFEEFNLYHRKDGLIVKIGEDIMSATRYAVMCKRLAQVKGFKRADVVQPSYPQPQGWMS